MDISGLQRFSSQLFGTLLGQGQGGEGDVHAFVRVESGQLADEISKTVGPKSQARATDAIETDVRKFLTIKPEYSLFDEGQKESSTADFTWLASGPGWILGANNEDLQEGASSVDAVVFVRGGQASGSRGKAQIKLGTRGSQSVELLNRTKVRVSVFSGAVKAISKNLGILKASFAYTAQKLLTRKSSPPAFVARHIESQAQHRAIFNDSQMGGFSPLMEFGSSSYGVVSNPRINESVSIAIEKRKDKMESKLRKVISGYTYNWNTGGVFRSQAELINSEN